jgi:hypothetical protein
MNDATYLMIVSLFGIVFILIIIYRALTKQRLSDEDKQHIKPKQINIEEKLDDDLVTNPAYSFLDFNLFHKDQHDDDD